MTDYYLQDVLVDTVKETLEHCGVAINGKKEQFHVYAQHLPIKRGKDDNSYFPYVLVHLDEETIGEEYGESEVSVYFLVGIKNENTDNRGVKEIVNVLNALTIRFLKNNLAGGFRMKLPIRKKFQEDDTFPYFFGGMATLWEIPTPTAEGTQYD